MLDTIKSGAESLVSPQIERPNVIGKEEVRKATTILEKYKEGKANLEDRVIKDEQWWKLRHWEAIGKEEDENTPEATSAWLFNTIISKHADATDNYPIPAVLPREQSDEESAKTLSEVLPVILENNQFDDTYSECWWDKLKHGTGIYGVFWNPTKDNGLGDIDIRAIDLLNIFWEPGIKNIQDSRNLFITQLIDKDILKAQYPDAGEINGNAIDVSHYVYDDTVNTDDKVVVVDWYYKKNGVLHYCKYVGDTVLYATENDYVSGERGLYDHGLYPVVFDVLYPEKGTPVGFGLVSIDKNPQLYVDSLASNLLESSMIGSKKRWFVSGATSINEEELCDWNKPIIHVEGSLDDLHIKEFVVQPISPIYVELMNQKITEMKETSGNRDMSNGGTYSGVTAASAIAALQEAGNKTSRDMINTSYRSYTDIIYMVVELIRQFYDYSRSFRITGNNSEYQYASLSNDNLKDSRIGIGEDGEDLYRKPIFDYKMKAMKRNPFSRMEENERAKELYGLGFFNPDRAQEALIALEMMDFEGIDDIKQKVSEGQTMAKIVEQVMSLNERLSAMVGVPSVAESINPMQGAGAPIGTANQNPLTDSIMQSRAPQSAYTQQLVQRGKLEV